LFIPDATLLFLGYGLEDWDFRVIWEQTLALRRERRRSTSLSKSYAVVKDYSDFQREFWRDRSVILVKSDLTELAKSLAQEFNLEIPQLGIAKTQGGAGA
jgi:hypothetical protein